MRDEAPAADPELPQLSLKERLLWALLFQTAQMCLVAATIISFLGGHDDWAALALASIFFGGASLVTSVSP